MVLDGALVEAIGYMAGAFMLTMAGMKTQRSMRLCHVGANLSFIAYGLLAGALPVALVNAIILLIHMRWFAARIRLGRSRHPA
ncbi:MAG: hypothetical protein AAF739_17505 [Pseudomonadota bacterium]